MDLEEYRISASLSYDDLAKRMGVPSVSQMRRLALGEELLKDYRMERAIAISGGLVDAFSVHQRRMAFLRSRPGADLSGSRDLATGDPDEGGCLALVSVPQV